MMTEIGFKVLSSYEQGVYSGAKKSDGDKIVEDEKMCHLLTRMLNTKVHTVLKDGTTVTGTAKELVVAAAIGDAIHKGSMEKLKTLMTIKGEMKETSEVSLSLVDNDLIKRAIE